MPYYDMLRISKNYPNLVILGIIVARGDLMGILLFLFILGLIFLFYFVGFIIKLILGIVFFVIGLVVLLFLLGRYRK
ncbi:hypothetical protein FOA39_04215 [Streptococcus cristatus]|nr:hypothetical protein [Streptococcus cristatus]